MEANRQYSGWAATEGYDDFKKSSSFELGKIGEIVLDSITADSLRGSLRHPNGFLVNTLENESEGQLRLHIWPTGRVDDLTPHSHPWHMSSLVLAGTNREYIPTVRLNEDNGRPLMGTGFDEERKQITNAYTGRDVSFELGDLATYNARDYHHLPAGEFHITPLPQVEPIITLVRTGRQLFDNPTYVLRTTYTKEQLSNASDRKSPTEEEVELIWTQIKPILSEARSTL
jgi:hypothetical protein